MDSLVFIVARADDSKLMRSILYAGLEKAFAAIIVLDIPTPDCKGKKITLEEILSHYPNVKQVKEVLESFFIDTYIIWKCENEYFEEQKGGWLYKVFEEAKKMSAKPKDVHIVVTGGAPHTVISVLMFGLLYKRITGGDIKLCYVGDVLVRDVCDNLPKAVELDVSDSELRVLCIVVNYLGRIGRRKLIEVATSVAGLSQSTAYSALDRLLKKGVLSVESDDDVVLNWHLSGLAEGCLDIPHTAKQELE